jgi:opacity protein-like surface antigen
MRLFLHGIALICALGSVTARAEEPPSALDEMQYWREDFPRPADTAPGGSLPVESEEGRCCPQFYVSGIIGASFATLSSGGENTAGVPTPNTGAIAGDLLTAGGAGGVAFMRPYGLLRFEAEGRYRDALWGQTPSAVDPLMYDVQMSDAWSAMANVWRDFFLTNRLGVYGGGGIGAGGYRLSADDQLVAGSSDTSGFAWQAGAGVTYRIWNRTTLDLGYRFFDLGTASTPLFYGSDPAGNYASSFSASELLLSVRVYEPFRRFRP